MRALLLGVHERAAGVAVVDRRVGLQEVLVAIAAGLRGSALGADAAPRHGLADTERLSVDPVGLRRRD